MGAVEVLAEAVWWPLAVTLRDAAGVSSCGVWFAPHGVVDGLDDDPSVSDDEGISSVADLWSLADGRLLEECRLRIGQIVGDAI